MKKTTARSKKQTPTNWTGYKKYILPVWLIILTLIVLYLAFRQAPVSIPTPGRTTGLSNLSKWTTQTAKDLTPPTFLPTVKNVFRESYSETVQKIQAGTVQTTADARLQVSQLIQAKIRALNRSDETQLIQAAIPLSDALGERLGSSVQDDLASVQKAFTEIAKGL
ncbi:MAG: hypothetical protein LBT46_02785 [Planctomycetaceae bacterium]|nr:hypothetical protein [Planctomycetaceae bacterium]